MKESMATPTLPERLGDLDSPAEEHVRSASRATAELWGFIADTIREAREKSWEWLLRARGETRDGDAELAERAVAMDLAARMGMSESTVRSLGALASEAQERLPGLWEFFEELGAISPQNLRIAVELARPIPLTALDDYELAVLPLAMSLPPARLRVRVRKIAERMHPRSLDERAREAEQQRRVFMELADDGMAWLTAYLPAAAARRALVRIDATARSLSDVEGETRTPDQLRADVTSDLLTGDGTPHAVRATVAVTVPVLSLLGRSAEPGTLDGVVPIDPATARELCVDAPSFFRLLTDPVSSAVKDVDRRSHRPPADLSRFVRLRDEVCTVRGCNRPALRCDLDHVASWGGEHGPTSAATLHALCRRHHTIKHATRWTATGTHGRITWTSPSGLTVTPEPPAELMPTGPPRALAPAPPF